MGEERSAVMNQGLFVSRRARYRIVALNLNAPGGRFRWAVTRHVGKIAPPLSECFFYVGPIFHFLQVHPSPLGHVHVPEGSPQRSRRFSSCESSCEGDSVALLIGARPSHRCTFPLRPRRFHQRRSAESPESIGAVRIRRNGIPGSCWGTESLFAADEMRVSSSENGVRGNRRKRDKPQRHAGLLARSLRKIA